MKTLWRAMTLLILLLGIAWAAAHPEVADPAAIEQSVNALGPWGPVAFIALFVAAALLFLPGSALTLAAGALFGPLWGMLYSVLGATLGAVAAFLVSRYLARDFVRSRLSGRMESIVAGVEKGGPAFVAFTRLVPLFPYNLLNYAFGLTRIKLLPFAAVSAVTMAPGAAAYSYLGHAGQQLATGKAGAIQSLLLALSALAVLAIVATLLKRSRQLTAPEEDHAPA